MKNRVGRCVALALVVASATASDARQSSQVPARDGGSVSERGTSAIAGVILSAEAVPRPLARAIVTVAGAALSSPRSTITDEEGRFAFVQLPAGSYTVTGRKAAFVNGAFGATRPGRPGTPIAVPSGQRAEVRIFLARGGVVTGTIRDGTGRPLPNILVGVISPKDPRLDAFFSSGQYVQTDDLGSYRIFGLAPGDYIVAAFQRLNGSGEIGVRRAVEMDALLAELARRAEAAGSLVGATPAGQAVPSLVGQPDSPSGSARAERPPIPLADGATLAPSFFPGTALFSAAEPVRVAAGDERRGVDFIFAPVRTVTIEGVVQNPLGAQLAGVQLSIDTDGPRISVFLGTSLVLSTPPGPDGAFKYTNVAPGRYTVVARARIGEPSPVPAGRAGGAGGGNISSLSGGSPPAPAGTVLYAVGDVDVTGGSARGLSLVLRPGVSIRGRLAFDDGTVAPPVDVSKVRVLIGPPGGTSMSVSNGTTTGNSFAAVTPPLVTGEATFAATNVAPGRYTVQAQLPAGTPTGWWLRSVTTRGVDLLDVPLDIRGDDIDDLLVTFSSRHSELGGTLQTPGGQPAPDYYVVVFTTDRPLWRNRARRVRVIRPDTHGAFTVRDLPEGEYFIAALTDLAEGEWNDPAFLEALSAASVRVSVKDGSRTIQDLRIAG